MGVIRELMQPNSTTTKAVKMSLKKIVCVLSNFILFIELHSWGTNVSSGGFEKRTPGLRLSFK